jgi:hypothetical protein
MSTARFQLKAPKVRLSENNVEGACLDILRLRGYLVLRQESGLFKTPDGRWIRVGQKGLPDYAALHGQHLSFLLEVKRPGGKLSPDQSRKIQEISLAYRVPVVVVDSAAALGAWLNEHEANQVISR